MTALSLVAALLAGCGSSEPVVLLADIAVDLYTPANVDAMEGADELVVRVLDPWGEVLAFGSGTPDEGVALSELQDVGIVVIEVQARSEGEVVSAGRSTPIIIDEAGTPEVSILFLPVNKAVELVYRPDRYRLGHLTVTTVDHKVLLIGGRSPSSDTVHDSSTWFDPLVGFFPGSVQMPRPTYGMSEVVLGDGSRLVTGGIDVHGDPVADAWTLMPDAGRLDGVNPMPNPRSEHCLAHTQESAALAVGGLVEPQFAVDGVRNDGSGNLEWTQYLMDDLVAADVSGCIGPGDGWVLTVGASPDAWGVMDRRLSSNDDLPESWRPLGTPMPGLEGAHLVLRGGDVYVFGGYDAGRSRAGTEGYRVDFQRAEAIQEPSLVVPRAWGEWRWWSDEILVFAGGYDDALQVRAVYDVEFFDIRGSTKLIVPVPVREARLEMMQGGAIALLGGLRDDGFPSGAWMVMPWME